MKCYRITNFLLLKLRLVERMEDKKRNSWDPAGSAGRVLDEAGVPGSQALQIPWIPVKQRR